MKHATVVKDGFTVPLFGIPMASTLEECDCCHDQFPLREVTLCGKQFLCKKCRD